jgi:hypothetical protein
VLCDSEFLASLGTIRASREAALRVRQEVASATRIPADRIRAEDKIQDLETVGRPIHFSVLDCFTDLLSVEDPRDESRLITVRDSVTEFGPQMKKS